PAPTHIHTLSLHDALPIYTYDVLNRIQTVSDPGQGVTRYTYDAVSNLIRTDLPNGTVEARSYDDLNRLTYLEDRGPSGVIASFRDRKSTRLNSSHVAISYA